MLHLFQDGYDAKADTVGAKGLCVSVYRNYISEVKPDPLDDDTEEFFPS